LEDQMRDSEENERVVFVAAADHEDDHEVAALGAWRHCGVECDGAGRATCHLDVDEPWVARLDPPSDDDLSRLDEAPVVETSSRLCSRILLSPKTNELRLRMAPGSRKA
jgi:hypothetical protein